MLAAYRLAGLSALAGHYAGLNALPQFGPAQGSPLGIVGKAEPQSGEQTPVRGRNRQSRRESWERAEFPDLGPRSASPTGRRRQGGFSAKRLPVIPGAGVWLVSEGRWPPSQRPFEGVCEGGPRYFTLPERRSSRCHFVFTGDSALRRV